MKQLAIIIPVYNEEGNIKQVVHDWKKILNKKNFDIIIINDGSIDKTKSIISEIKKKTSNLKIINKTNGGHGETVFTGYEYAIKKKYKFIFQVDSDNQFSAKDFLKFWKIRNKSYDLILGNRKSRKDSLLRVFLSKIILRVFFLILFKRNILDANIPYRLIKYKFLKDFLKKGSKTFIAPNILMTLYAKKIKFLNVKHFERSEGIINWPIKKLIYFGTVLLLEIFKWKQIIEKENS